MPHPKLTPHQIKYLPAPGRHNVASEVPADPRHQLSPSQGHCWPRLLQAGDQWDPGFCAGEDTSQWTDSMKYHLLVTFRMSKQVEKNLEAGKKQREILLSKIACH